jgi:hypothetical protein
MILNSFFNRVFNLSNNEWPRVSQALLMKLFYRIGFVLGWTMLVGLFVSHYGIFYLPLLFVINAFFTMLGTVFFSTFLNKFKKTSLMIGVILVAAGLLIGSAYFLSDNFVLFFLMLLVVESVFLMQFKILSDGYVEEMFNPLESERTFPIIESSETIGGILAGVLLFSLSDVFASTGFVYIWAIFTLLMIPLILQHEGVNKEESLTKIKKGFKDFKKASFLKGLLLIVFLHWFLFSLVEFQYTSMVYKSTSNVILEGGSGFEHAFIHDLGGFFVLFSFSALLVQLFLGSRLIKSLGIMNTMLLHPLVTLLSVFALTMSFTFPVAILMKNNFIITTALFLNVYHSAYYAIREKYREYSREFLEGVIRPVGALLGTIFLMGLQLVSGGDKLSLSLNVFMVMISLLMLFVVYYQQDNYSKVALDDLLKSKDKNVRLNAIDILSQKGHKKTVNIFRKILKDKNELACIKEKILCDYSELQEKDFLEDIIECLNAKEKTVREAALVGISNYKDLKKVDVHIAKNLDKLMKNKNMNLINENII